MIKDGSLTFPPNPVPVANLIPPCHEKHEAGEKVKDLCRELGIHNTTFYDWRAKFGGLETENRHLKQLVVDLSLDVKMLKEVNSRKW